MEEIKIIWSKFGICIGGREVEGSINRIMSRMRFHFEGRTLSVDSKKQEKDLAGYFFSEMHSVEGRMLRITEPKRFEEKSAFDLWNKQMPKSFLKNFAFQISSKDDPKNLSFCVKFRGENVMMMFEEKTAEEILRQHQYVEGTMNDKEKMEILFDKKKKEELVSKKTNELFLKIDETLRNQEVIDQLLEETGVYLRNWLIKNK